MVFGIPLKIGEREIRPGVVVLELTGQIHMSDSGLATNRAEKWQAFLEPQ